MDGLAMMADPLLAHSTVDRLASAAHEPVIEGPLTGNAGNHQSTAAPLACPLTTRKESRLLPAHSRDEGVPHWR
jgi:hypothetical protein